MSVILQILKGASKSNTVQFNAIMLAVWTAIFNSDLVQSNPEYVAILGGLQALVGIILRWKTDTPLSSR